jgi:hypothetical protein
MNVQYLLVRNRDDQLTNGKIKISYSIKHIVL